MGTSVAAKKTLFAKVLVAAISCKAALTYYPYEVEGQSCILKRQKNIILVNTEIFVVEGAPEEKSPISEKKYGAFRTAGQISLKLRIYLIHTTNII